MLKISCRNWKTSRILESIKLRLKIGCLELENEKERKKLELPNQSRKTRIRNENYLEKEDHKWEIRNSKCGIKFIDWIQNTKAKIEKIVI